jgi:hypothetical protein
MYKGKNPIHCNNVIPIDSGKTKNTIRWSSTDHVFLDVLKDLKRQRPIHFPTLHFLEKVKNHSGWSLTSERILAKEV